jgi:hypothetical protein
MSKWTPRVDLIYGAKTAARMLTMYQDRGWVFNKGATMIKLIHEIDDSLWSYFYAS